MPFRRAHLALLLLFPLILAAFWPGYFGRMRTAPLALHAHGMTATAWIVLATVQAWAIDARRPALHRSAGLATFAVVPAFAAAGMLAMRDMAVLGLAGADPFHAAYGVRLALIDAASLAAFLTLVGWGLVQRRRTATHAGAMLGTILLVLPPVLGRLIPSLPGFPVRGIAAFPFGFHLGNAIAAAMALLLARRQGRAAGPLTLVAVVLASESLAFETVARSATWTAVARSAAGTPAILVALFGVTASAAMLWTAWHAPSRQGADPGVPVAG